MKIDEIIEKVIPFKGWDLDYISQNDFGRFIIIALEKGEEREIIEISY